MRRVTGVTTWGTACGIAEHSLHLRDACAVQQLPVTFTMSAEMLDPTAYFLQAFPPDVLWLNYHMGLHSRWTPEVIRRVRTAGTPVVLTLHDTYDGQDSPNSERAKDLAGAASACIVHEPVADIEGAIVLRQGVPDASYYQLNLDRVGGWLRPILGSVGFPFPWKNYDRLAQLTRDLGWGLCLFAPTATEEDERRWRVYNPWSYIYRDFLPSSEVIGALAFCTATAFMYECGNSGTSGAIRQGIAARKPVFALKSCRQFRDLVIAEEQEGDTPLIHWVGDWADLRWMLKQHTPVSVDPKMVYLAERDSWRRQARAYVEIFERAMGGQV